MAGPSFHLDVHSRPLPLRGHLVPFLHRGSPRGFQEEGGLSQTQVHCQMRGTPRLEPLWAGWGDADRQVALAGGGG